MVKMQGLFFKFVFLLMCNNSLMRLTCFRGTSQTKEIFLKCHYYYYYYYLLCTFNLSCRII